MTKRKSLKTAKTLKFSTTILMEHPDTFGRGCPFEFTKSLCAILTLFLGALTTIKAQKHAYFGQPYLNPMTVNAALTGAMNAQNRVILHYKNWDTPYKENFFAVGLEHRFELKNNDYFGVGAHIWQSDMGILEQKQLKTAFSYSKYLGGNGQGNTQYLMAGTEFGLQNSILDWNRNPIVAFNNYTTGNGAALPISKIDSFYVSTGALWCSTWKNGKSAHFGMAVHRLFTPLKTTSYNFNLPVLWRYSFHGGVEFPMRRNFLLVPTFIFMKQGDYTDIRSSLGFKIAKDDLMILQFGAYHRYFTNRFDRENTEGVLGLFGRLDMGVYSASVSQGFSSSFAPSLEFALTYRFGELMNEKNRVPVW
jgi:hypothetical protein